jgi:uncharacterized protein YyaL (SSP411 family)
MNTNRRKFLRSTTALTASAAAGSMLRWGVESAEAQAMGGYKAIVCVFLFGGNDSNNMIVPVTDYAQYAATRTVASNVGLTQAQLAKRLPFISGMKTIDGKATAYVCEHYSCRKPVSEPAELEPANAPRSE